MPPHARTEPGSPSPLGATWDGRGVNFALFSANAERVELCLFDTSGRKEVERIVLPEYTNQVWHGYIVGLHPNQLYGYRVYGPYDPRLGHRFNPNKLLIDPYARALEGNLVLSDAHFGYRKDGSKADMGFDRRDTARITPKCRVVEPAFTWGPERLPNRPWSDTVIYELHVKGFTKMHPQVAEAERGTFVGLGSPPVIDHLVKLGVTAVELLPIHAIADEPFLVDSGRRNYWGYSSINFFAADPRFFMRDRVREFKMMVANLHAADIEVILDVVYNHTGEGNELGPTISFRGIDNASYYVLSSDKRRYTDYTGCGNTLNMQHPRVLQMVMDSLRYWVQEMHVDGFRFDLTSTLCRENGRFDGGSSFLDVISQDPVLSQVKLIAEPWDLGMDGYQVGNFPPGWAEWNDRYRDAIRRFWRGDGGVIGDVASRLTGSADRFQHDGRRPWSSINFITAHDGFTLYDLVAYNQKHNEANGENNRDGTDNNNSWNCGVEGPTDDPAIKALRSQQMRNILATLLLAQGTPMLVAGDEFARTQKGNNNAYCQDNEIGWVNWDHRGDDGHRLTAFTQLLMGLRRKHAVFRRSRFLTGTVQPGSSLKDVTWLVPEGREMATSDWNQPHARCLGAELFHNRDGAPSEKAELFVIILNAHDGPVHFKLPRTEISGHWRPLFDTARPDMDLSAARYEGGHAYPVLARSFVLLQDS